MSSKSDKQPGVGEQMMRLLMKEESSGTAGGNEGLMTHAGKHANKLDSTVIS